MSTSPLPKRYLDPKIDLAFKREYRSNGQHATFEEADTWLAKLESGQDVDPPKCHD